jgi:tRNA splicing ligase
MDLSEYLLLRERSKSWSFLSQVMVVTEEVIDLKTFLAKVSEKPLFKVKNCRGISLAQHLQQNEL